MLLVCRFDVPADGTGEDTAATDAFLVRARRACELLAAQPGCAHVDVARATEAPDRWVLVAAFASAADYRRALSPFAVREHVVPLLAEALTDEPATFERRLSAGPDGVTELAGVLD